jgi:hypothetical protein
MTLGLDRKAVTSDGAGASQAQTSKYNSVQVKSPKSPTVSPLAKPKTLLSNKCTELKASGLSVIHSVQLLLTSYHEVLVLKKGDKSRNQTVLRRHSVVSDSFKEHGILTTALLVEIPNTLLSYVYQFEKEKTLRQWLERISACRRESPEIDRIEDAVIASGSADICARNGMIANHTAPTLTSPVDEAVEFPSARQVPRRRDAVKQKMRDFVKEKSPLRSSGYRYYRQGPGSPERRTRAHSMILDHSSFDRGAFHRSSQQLGRISLTRSCECPPVILTSCDATAVRRACKTTGSDSSSVDTCTDVVMAHRNAVALNSDGADFSTFTTSCECFDPTDVFAKSRMKKPTLRPISSEGVLNGGERSSAGSEELKEEAVCIAPAMVVTTPELEDSPILRGSHSVQQQMVTADSSGVGDVVGSLDNPGSPAALHSPASISRNSSARSSGKSVGAGSARSLNLAVLQESLELKFVEQNESIRRHSTSSDRISSPNGEVQRRRRYSSSSDHVNSNGEIRSSRSLNNHHSDSSLTCGDHDAKRRLSPSREHMGLNLSEKRNGIVRRASDQLAGLLKMHSFREKERRKRCYVRISSSVSELDSMLGSDHNIDFLGPSRRPHSRNSCHTPITTPTSPLAQIRVLSPSNSPVFSGEILEGGLEEEMEEESESEKPEAFLVSRFHHTQIRNRKRKQSPRIRRTISTNEEGAGRGVAASEGKHVRSISESPTSTAAHALYQKMEVYQNR